MPRAEVAAEAGRIAAVFHGARRNRSGGLACVAQAYVERPLLVGGHKFDLRLYVLVTSFGHGDARAMHPQPHPPQLQPRAYLFREGFARFASAPFSLADDELSNPFVHLTNNCINKRNTAVQGGPKLTNWSLARLFAWMRAQSPPHDCGTAWAAVRDLVAATVASAAPVVTAAMAKLPTRPRAGLAGCGSAGSMPGRACFELLGVDVLLDDALRPWLLEVNGQPTLAGTLHLPGMLEALFRELPAWPADACAAPPAGGASGGGVGSPVQHGCGTAAAGCCFARTPAAAPRGGGGDGAAPMFEQVL